MRRCRVRGFVALVVAAVLTGASPLIGNGALPAAAAPDWQPPGFVRSIGGAGEAGVYPWGMEYNPVTDEILVGDYWNFKVRRYDRVTGRQLGAFFRPANVRKGQPYTISVNPINGDIYVPEWGDGQMWSGAIGRYDKYGTYIGEVLVRAAYHVWTHIDAQGYLWVADSHFWNSTFFPPQIRKFDLSGASPVQVLSFGTFGAGPGQLSSDVHGISTDAAGNVYVADAINRRVHVFGPDGTWLRDFGSPGTKLGQFRGDLRGLEIDRVNGWVYVVDAEAGQIEKFALDGTPLARWGSVGAGAGQYADGGREVAVDRAGHLWSVDYGNFRFFEYPSNGGLLRTLPNPAQPPPVGNFSQNRDVAVDPLTGDVWAADSWNNRFQRFGPTGVFTGAWGVRNSHPPYGMNYPRGIAIDPETREVWVANTREMVIQVYDKDANYLRTIGNGVKSEAPGSFVWPMDIELHGGKAYVTNYYGSSLRILDATTGTEIGRIAASQNGVAVDPAGNIYLLSWSRDEVSVYSPDGTVNLFRFGSRGTGPGQFDDPWDIDIAGGLVYVTDAGLARVTAFTLDGTYVGEWGGKGDGAFQFEDPSGITHDAAGNIYVADAGNNRVQVFSFGVGRPSGDTTAPALSVAAPSQDAVLPAQSPALIKGTASDAVGVARVEVAVRDTATGQWWNANEASWQVGRVFNQAPWSGPDATRVSYAYSFVAVERGGRYSALVRAVDTSGNIRTIATARRFSIAS
jgi:DNA-binding beta-propeller fold protein YncE